MTPDSHLVSECRPSPNHDERRDGQVPAILLLHYTGMKTGEAALERLCDPQAAVSSHYLVEEDGRVFQLVPEARRAWHAGEGAWHGARDVNSRSIGIEIVNPGHEHGYRPFPARQIEAVIELCKDCVARWAILPQNVLAHSDTAPDRKQDPGELFPWDQLSAAGVGLGLAPVPIAGGRFLSPGERGQPVEAWQGLLAAFGYSVPIDGLYGEETRLATLAFQRHHRRELVDGVADLSTIKTLHGLLTTIADKI
ncbi:peptidoglycan recognition protein family protein [Aureimonas populi]|uniref:N-acetylmuramoyl-L-alanine amidase n=1 Tax=Aureimonas populi TaxID=1701758 RepID=A0ABW5CKE0_9HYPH|nr:N-acetylmuramoyl-L-alanine amidase [Aureimonas populi]